MINRITMARSQLRKALSLVSSSNSNKVCSTIHSINASIPRRSSSGTAACTQCPVFTSQAERHRRRPQIRRKISTESNNEIRQQSKQISNVFWKELKLAVHQKNAARAEELVYRLLDDAKEQGSLLDTKLFSLVLNCWRDASEDGESEAATRSQQLLDHIISLYNEGLLTQPPHLEDYHVVLSCIRESDYSFKEASPDNIHRLLEQLLRNHTPTMETYELIISIFAKGGHLEDAKQLFHVVALETSLSPSVELYNSVLECWANSLIDSSVSRTSSSDTRTEKRNTPPATTTGTSPQEAHAFFLEMIKQGFAKPNTKTCELLIRCYATSRGADAAIRAQQILDQMRGLRIKANSNAYKYAIQILAREGEAERAAALLSRHVKDYTVQFDADLKPDLQVFQLVLYAYSRSHHPHAASKAESLLTHMKELHQSEMLYIQPNTWSYNTVMQCVVNSRASDSGKRAMLLYEEMKSLGLVPDTASLNTLLQAYALSEPADLTDELLRTNLEVFLRDPIHNPQPDTVSFGTVLNAWAKSSSFEAPEKAESLLSLLGELSSLQPDSEGLVNCKPDVVTYTNVMQIWANSKRRNGPEKAEALLRELQQLESEGDVAMAPDTVCWNSVLSAWAQAGNGERAESLLKEMLTDYMRDKTRYPAPTAITFTAVLSAWAKTKNNNRAPGRALSILRHMERLNESGALEVRPNVVHYSSVLNCLAYSKCRQGAIQAEKLLCEMTTSNHPDTQPNIISYNCCVKAWSFLRDKDAFLRANSLLMELVEKSKQDPKLRPNGNTFGGVLKALASSKVEDKEKKAETIVKLMEGFGILKNDWTRNQLRRCKVK